MGEPLRGRGDTLKQVRRALLSVHDKTGLVDFARGLSGMGFELVSSGGTHAEINKAGIRVAQVSEVTGFPEMLEGRVKTLHPKIHAGILARCTPDHMAQIGAHGIEPFEMVAVNLYPFESVVARGCALDEAVENIDIGGPSLVRAAAKNHERVAIVVSPSQYPSVLEELSSKGAISHETRKRLAVEAFETTAAYDAAIYSYLYSAYVNEPFPRTLVPVFRKQLELRYGENPYQRGCFYREARTLTEPSITTAKQLHGKQLSYNNILDANDTLEMVKDFDRPTASAVKHTNPCGIASADDILAAYKSAVAVDPLSVYGGIVAVNRPMTLEVATELKPIFLEVVIAPSYEPDALAQLQKKKNLRILETGPFGKYDATEMDMRKVVGGILVQDRNLKRLDMSALKVVSKRQPTPDELVGMEFAYRVVKHVKSNSIVLAKGETAVGIGAGQMSRVDAVELAVKKSRGASAGSVMASDAYFPFPDGIIEAAKGGVTAAIHPGGSIRDQEAIDAADERGMAMAFTNLREFKH
ncbi:MAG: bifunctional phosphoribosylaminoimidazolecarboxamide formyltransferase/IMP cyclohydrolase [Methanobacteriota archaeon]